MEQIITKFGGTSVSSRETWDNILTITQQHIDHGNQPIIVCSALTQISNKLEKSIDAALLNQHHSIEEDIQQSHAKLADALEVSVDLIQAELKQLNQLLTGIALLKAAPAKTRAEIMSLGELMMTRLGYAFLHQQGISIQWKDVRQMLVSKPILNGDDTVNYLAAHADCPANPELRKQLIDSGFAAIITQGFFVANAEGETVLLGRGGSDTSAALLAASLETKFCEIWTDVPGIYTANPHQIPQARLLKQLNYDEAQEIATMGGKVLHPNCIPPVRHAKIPMAVKFTKMPQHSGTLVSQESDMSAPPIKSIQVKHSITLISIDTLNMWQQVGFLADVFEVFKQHGFSVDLLSSSEFNVTVSLDNNAKLYERSKLDALIQSLNGFCRAKVIEPCSGVSLVGHHIRTVLPQLGPVLELFENKKIHLLSLASNDLNLTFVVDESHAEKLCQKLHHLLIESNPQSFYYSKTWHEEFGAKTQRCSPWWELERNDLLHIAKENSPCYVYHRPTISENADALLQLKAIDKLFYAMKANPHPEVLRTLYAKKIGFECVSQEELEFVLQLFPEISPQDILFTPNFAPQHEYIYALEVGCFITIDNLYVLQQWPDLFSNKSILLRIDPGSGAGHHKFVSTAGNESKFGIPQSDIEEAIQLCKSNHIQVVGLHSHSGSGILTPDLWESTAVLLSNLVQAFPSIKIINLGGGLGVADKPGQQNLDLTLLDNALITIKARYKNIAFWLEPGRYFVSDAGVILAKTTQCKKKGKVNFVGIETGMNSLIRPALYGAYHEIVNLTQLHQEKSGLVHIVGPICESGDTLGYDRPFPKTEAGDVVLIANAGAYGHAMSSHYNLRAPAQEIVID